MSKPLGKPILPLTPKTARRLADIDEALEAGALGPVTFLDASQWVLPDYCERCNCQLEAGHCYCCFPVGGYGDRFAETRHGAKILDARKRRRKP